MKIKQGTLILGICIVTICGLVLTGRNAVHAQNAAQEGIVGTWNFQGTVEINPPIPFIFVVAFNDGGTTVEIDSTATGNPSTGESISLGTWKQTGTDTSAFRQVNYTFDASGNLSSLAISSFKLTLDSNADSLTGPGSVSFYSCTVSQCPGALIAGPVPETVTGKRI
jgi:hypothetical protein